MKGFKVIFWDFDGVIKDSVKVKSEAYTALFEPYGSAIAEKIRKHHEANGGISRFEKIPLYLEWAGLQTTASNIDSFCAKFSTLVFQAVIDAPWVPGVNEYLLAHYQPHRAMRLWRSWGPWGFFGNSSEFMVHLYRKTNILRRSCRSRVVPPGRASMIGDLDSDMTAAQANRVSFLLRRTAENHPLQNRFVGPKIDNFLTLDLDILWTD